MKKLLTALGAVVIAFGVGYWLIAADHIEAPAVTGTSADITDYYAFESPANSDNYVFIANTQGLLAPGATADATFDENLLLEFNIDNDGDNIEDLVIQGRVRNGILKVYGPSAPASPGLNSTLVRSGPLTSVEVTGYQQTPIVGSEAGISVFAGPRDDPFFMDFTQFGEIIAGNATGFNDPGTDTFAGTNVLSVVVEVPKSMLGSNTINSWLEAKNKTN